VALPLNTPLHIGRRASAMVPSDSAMTSFYAVSKSIMSISAAIWPQFRMQ